ncbi:MAG: chorismate synthase [Firmicutes bacterium]|jgi:chorismate synthase|nr:chorismate synthase [Bacillota bacterium]
MASEFGKLLRVALFGESHGPAVGVLVDGLPAGEAIDLEALQQFMERRRPGRDPFSSARREPDRPRFLSGITGGRTNGSPLCAIIENVDARSSDYAALADTPRPGHADYTAHLRWKGWADQRGGGHLSGRLTAPLCLAGAIAAQILARRGIHLGAHLASVAGICDEPFPLEPAKELFRALSAKSFPVIDEAKGLRMQEQIAAAAARADSVGGVVECAATGLPAGLGSPRFGGVESRLAAVLFGIPALKGLEFGSGFAGAGLRGSQNNDPFWIDEGGAVRMKSNRSGGVLGGITSGAPLLFRAAFKPTPSIGQPQQTVSLSRLEPETITIKGRHDPCIAPRAVPAVEAVTAAVILDLILEG